MDTGAGINKTTNVELPAPARIQLIQEVAEKFCDDPDMYQYDTGNRREKNIKLCLNAFSHYHESTLRRIMVLDHRAKRSILAMLRYEGSAFPDYTVNDWCMLFPLADRHGFGSRELYLTIQSLDYYQGMPPQSPGNYPEARLEIASAILLVTRHLDRNGIDTYTVPTQGRGAMDYIPDEELRALLIISKDPMFTADLIITREITTGKQLADLLETSNGIASSLKNGTL